MSNYWICFAISILSYQMTANANNLESNQGENRQQYERTMDISARFLTVDTNGIGTFEVINRGSQTALIEVLRDKTKLKKNLHIRFAKYEVLKKESWSKIPMRYCGTGRGNPYEIAPNCTNQMFIDLTGFESVISPATVRVIFRDEKSLKYVISDDFVLRNVGKGNWRGDRNSKGQPLE